MSPVSNEFLATVEFCEETCPGSKIFKLVLRAPEIFPKAAPGHFILIETLAQGSSWRRPFSIAEQNGSFITCYIKVAGQNTQMYSDLIRGENVHIWGPCGKPIPTGAESYLPPDFNLADNYLLVAGGVGFATLLPYAESLLALGSDVKILYGTKYDNEFFGLNALRRSCRIGQITEHEGLVTDLLEEELAQNLLRPLIVACGPMPMLAKTAQIADDWQVPCLVVLEERMACGSGACKGCAVLGRDGSVKQVCEDGPAFDAAWIDWDKTLRHDTEAGPTVLPANRYITTEIMLSRGGQERKLMLRSPVMNASGCVDPASVLRGRFDISCAGAIVLKGVTSEPRSGNRLPRVCETESGMINSIGLENPGVNALTAKYGDLKNAIKLGFPVIANISGSTVDDYVYCAEMTHYAGADAIEINVSCPNLERHKQIFGKSPAQTAKIVAAIRSSLLDAFLIVKLTPAAGEDILIKVAKAAVRAGADAICACNTFPAMKIDISTLRPDIGNNYGGLSGPAIRPLSVKLVNDLYLADLGVPIIGVGGIDSAEAALEYILAGASAVQVGTALFKNPSIMTEIHEGLIGHAWRLGANAISDLIGKVALYG